ncbi:copper amine oxidase N-terminal domain-containing protein [Paenibacillus harenae]|uniref:copper amine oxidase N-terminal domain-containing protein n=1 Tax=Paenibacillus harenae TaxID=306543 RepID=UPI0003F6ED2F|nr:copper amine oxidase N-terminal domain-containing protein [Paenibacillus harenae]
MKKNILMTFFAFLCLLVPLTSTSAESLQNNALKLKLNGAFLIYSKGTMPYIDTNNRTLVPLRVFSDVLDGEIEWNNSTKTVTFKSSELSIIAALNKKEAIINGKNVKLDTSIANKNGTIMIPAKWVAEGLEIPINWDSKNKVVSMNYEKFFLTGPLERMNNEQRVDYQFNTNIIPLNISYGENDGYESLKIKIYNDSEHVYQKGELQDHLLVLVNNSNVIDEGTKGETNSDRSDLRLITKIDSNETYEYYLPVGRLDQKQLQVDYPQYAFIRFYNISKIL